MQSLFTNCAIKYVQMLSGKHDSEHDELLRAKVQGAPKVSISATSVDPMISFS